MWSTRSCTFMWCCIHLPRSITSLWASASIQPFPLVVFTVCCVVQHLGNVVCINVDEAFHLLVTHGFFFAFFWRVKTFSAWEQSETVQVWKHHVCPLLCLYGCTANLNSIQWPYFKCKLSALFMPERFFSWNSFTHWHICKYLKMLK